jgi:hypothetical protein
VLLVLSGVLAVSRMACLSDMEFKGDERIVVEIVTSLGHHAWTPLAPVSNHSGVAHSSLVYYVMRFLSGSATQPLSIAAGIAFFNLLAILLPMWLLAGRRHYFATFAMCVTSTALIFGSRKIWEPDLQAAWVCLGIGFLGGSLEWKTRWSAVLAGTGAFCLVMAGHMYLPAMFVAAVACAAILLSFVLSKRRYLVRGWLIGAALGWATVMPWAVKMIAKAPGTSGAGGANAHLNLADLGRSFAMGITLPSPYPVYRLYLQSGIKELFAGPYGALLTLTLICFGLACVAWMILVVAATATTARRWRDALRDPLVLTFAALLVCMPLALYIARLGNYLHFWFAVIPFAYYWIAWALTRASRARQWLTRLLVLGCFTSLLAALSLGYLVHENKGLPGEYGQSYRASHR